jgi:23S rRNA (adenine1618-N6)-methyltransferase
MSKPKGLHKKNIHNDKYDFNKLIDSHYPLSEFVTINKYGDQSVDFTNPESVMAVNQALLSHFYDIKSWSIPKGHLCPPIPGRIDYIHYLAELLDLSTQKTGLDIGCGTGCIYPILGVSSYQFNFVASDIDSNSIKHSQNIINSNVSLKSKIELRLQPDPKSIFKNIIKSEERFDFTMCNPPFHASLEDATKGSDRKRKNLNRNKEKKGHKVDSKQELNFGGLKAELWCDGGELKFISTMIKESVEFNKNCKLFTTLVSKKENLAKLYKLLASINAIGVRSIQMQHGQKSSHILIWKF